MSKPKVLFLCTANSARSQMAEALLRQHAGDRFEVYSAGFEPAGIHPLTLQALQEAGLDVSPLRSKGIEEFLGKVHFGYIIPVCSKAEARCPTFPDVSIRLHWPFDDPAACEGSPAEHLEMFRRVRGQIEARVLSWLQELPPGE